MGTSPIDPADLAMNRYAGGDDAAFAEVYDRLAPRLYAFLMRRTRQPCAAEDLLQQTMLRMHRARGRFHQGASVFPWAIAIARRLVFDASRERRRRPTDGDAGAADDVEAGPVGPAHAVEARELATRLQERLNALPESQRVVFELLHHDGLSLAEAAEVLGTSVMAVKLRAHRAYTALRASAQSE